MKEIGIWLDKKSAYIIDNNSKDEQVLLRVQSEVEDFHPHGGSGTRFKGGPQDVVQDSKYLEREIHQLKSYFDEISKQVGKASQIVLFGPAQTAAKLNKEWMRSYPDLNKRVKDVLKADSMTENQMKAFVREYYSNPRPRSSYS